MRTNSQRLARVTLALFAFGLVGPGCTPDIPEGVLVCTDNAECPPTWICRVDRCYSGEGTDAGAPDTGRMDGGAVRCARDIDCTNGTFCDGVETCMPDATGADPVTGCLPPGAEACLATQACDETTDRCVTDCDADPDADGDMRDAIECGGMDCDDANTDVHPGHAETCDDVDNDCDPATFGDTDLDADGAVSDACCNPTPEGTLCGTDCNDMEPNAGSGDTEICDGLDNDCNGTTDDGLLTTYYLDGDSDTYGRAGMTMDACSAPSGYADRAGDCDDSAFGVNPGATETCNGIDDDCVGGIDRPECSCTNGATQTCGTDVGVCMMGSQTCVSGMWGPCTGATDGTAEVCDGLDNDCDTTVDGATASCPSRTNTSSTCVSPACTYACTAPFQTCDTSDPGDTTGCESNRNTDVAHCGGCTACGTPTNVATRWCVAGTCTVLTCTGLFRDCDGTFSNGCERAINTVTDCGSCGNVCTAPAGATATCGGGCSYACVSGRSDCDGDISNGCETARASCDAPPPRLTAPLNAMVVTSNRPVLRFVGVAGVPNAQVQVCSDPTCSTIVWTGIGSSPLTVGTSLPPGRYYWRARAVIGTTIGTAASAQWNFVTFATTTPTISTDAFPLLNVAGGREDLVIGDPTTGGGRVVLYESAGTTMTQILNAPANRQGFGSSISSVDANGDGFGDLIVGCCLASDVTLAPNVATGCSGAVVVYAGTAAGTFDATPMFNTVIGSGFGYSVAGIGDFDGDGYGDFAVGAYALSRVYIYLGSPAGVNATALTYTAGSTGHQFGWSVAAAGDTDGDFLDEVIVGQFSRAGGDTTSSVTVLRLRVLDTTVIPVLVSGRVPSRVTGMGDVNQDGRADYAVASTVGNGSVAVHNGSGSQLWTLTGTAGSRFGSSIIGLGDLNGDGRGDVAVGAPGTMEVFTYQGFTGSLIWSVNDSQPNFGYSLGRGGVQTPMPLTASLVIASCGPGAGCAAEVTLYDGRDMTTRSLRGLWAAPVGSPGFGLGLPR